ncbi:MAG: MarR family transcriptional regulator [Actinomycetota bacterium]|nr:MarR family transcriptional regulator [Actinomycetota bacterium]
MTNFDSELFDRIGLFLEAASYLQRNIYAALEEATGLQGAWFETMVRIYRSPTECQRVGELAQQVTFPASTFSRMLDKMEASELVERETDPSNRRATLVRLTSLGVERIEEALKSHDPIAKRFFSSTLEPMEMQQLEGICRRIRDVNS